MKTNNKTPLKRDISLFFLVFYGLGNILGAGIYVLIGEISGISGIYAPISFILACIVVLFTALCYAELSSRYPYSAGEALYAKHAFNSKYLSIAIGFFIGLSGILSSATIINGFYGYLSNFLDVSKLFTSIFLVFTLCFIAVIGISKSVKFASLLTLIEISGLLLIVYVGGSNIDFKAVEIQTYIPPLELSIWYTISLGAFLAFYAFIGFEDMVNVAEEVKNPTVAMPKAIIYVLIISTILYILVAFISIIAIEPSILSKSQAPLANVYKTLTQKEPIILSFIGMFAVINGALIQIIMVSRLLYGMSINKWIPEVFSSVNKSTNTPIFSTVFASIIILIFALWLPILTLAGLTSFFIFIIFALMNLALIRIKRKEPKIDGIISYPMWIPIVGFILNISLLCIQILYFTTN